MDIVKTFNGYGKVSEIADRHLRRTTRRRLAILAASAIVLVVIVVSVGVVAGIRHGDGSPSPTSIADSIKAMCNVTRYPSSCVSSISTARGANLTDDPEELFRISLTVAVDAIGKVSTVAGSFEIPANDKRLEAALRDCDQLFDSAIDRLNDSLSLMQRLPGEPLLNASKIEDLTTWLSAAVTDQETCLDGFEGTTGNVRDKMEVAMVNSTQYTSNSLATVVGILGVMEKLDFPLHRKLLSVPSAVRYPPWISRAQRRALRQDMARLEPNVTVAVDGSGQVKTIKEAIDLAPKKNAHPFTIYIKEGVYKENVVVDKSKWNVIVLGDGMYKTIVDGKLNFIDGTPTFSTATFSKYSLEALL
ncbi:hypothetical protein BHM03_00018015 [Ensete ventricosum]|uniref:Pectinesterase n=1 Tax=Ensete ventricosum TaxID=4639 RepID=A0A445MF44_ENSVE|nr:hypothetical protein BHM03_00018015 [Ensete ventricosum]